MGDTKKLVTAECYNCKDIVIPVDENEKEDGKKQDQSTVDECRVPTTTIELSTLDNIKGVI